jgi:hypothetical protein
MRALKVNARQLQEWEDAMPGLSLRTDWQAKVIVNNFTSIGMTPARASEYREAGFHALHNQDAVTILHIGGVPPTYVQGAMTGTEVVFTEDLVLLYKSGVPREDAFGHGYSAHVFLDLHAKGVPTSYIAQLARAGFQPRDVLFSWTNGLAPEYAVAFHETGIS